MILGHFIANEQNVSPDQVMLLRHSNQKVNKLVSAGANILDDYTFVQPSDSKYDFIADNKPLITVLVVIVFDKVFGVYQVNGVAEIGTSRTLVSPNFIAFDIAEGFYEIPSKKFSMTELTSEAKGLPITGWTCPLNPVARSGYKMFDSVRLLSI